MAKQREKTVTGRVLHDPVKDKLRPMFPLDLSKCRTVDELVRAMGDTAFTGRQIGDAADVFEQMARDKDCFVVMTLSGALTVGKMGLVFCDLIESGIVKAIVSTGALMAHGLVEATGYSHFRYNPNMDDKELFHAGYNRVYDSLEPETNLVMGRGRHCVQLEDSPAHRRVLAQDGTRTGNSEIRFRAQCSYFCPCLQRF
jgi:deoxyhypusine synthase